MNKPCNNTIVNIGLMYNKYVVWNMHNLILMIRYGNNDVGINQGIKLPKEHSSDDFG